MSWIGIEGFKEGLLIRTNALTHLLALRDREKTTTCRTMFLYALMRYGADATAPALYEVESLVARNGFYRSYAWRVAITVEEERCFALVAARALQSLSSVRIQEIRMYTGLPLLQAASINEGVHTARESQVQNFNKCSFFKISLRSNRGMPWWPL